MKIFAIGLNYASHNEEMKSVFESDEPVIFMKPDTALLKDGKPFFLPDFSNEIHYETENRNKNQPTGEKYRRTICISIL